MVKGIQTRLQLQQKAREETLKLEKSTNKENIAASASLFGALGDIASTGGKELFEISRAFNTAEAITSGYLAVQKALASVPYPANLIAATAVGIKTAANVIRIQRTQAPNFEQGGFVPGNSFRGDNVNVNVNSGEAILNSRQQRNFMKLANNQSSGPNETVIRNIIQLDGQQITESVSRFVADGFELGEIV
jgi:hypothetical protein